MNVIYAILGIVPAVLFFINIRNAADVLCRIIGGFAFLIIYNMLAPAFSFMPVGINLISSAVAGIIGIPGWILLLCCNCLL